MPYTAPTMTDMIADLARALGDPSQRFWAADELERLIIESLQTWNSYASYWRSRRQFATVANQHFYDLLTLGLVTAPADQGSLLNDICYAMIEPFPDFPGGPYTFTNFPTTEQYLPAQINEATLQAYRQFQFDAGMVMFQETLVGVPSAPSYIVQLNENVADVRHFNIQLQPQTTRYPLRRIDEFAAQQWTAGASLLNGGLPYAYSFLFPTSQPAIRLIPPPDISGDMEIISVRSSSFPPTDYNWPAKWLALSFLLTQDGQSRDHQRAVYCRKRYQDAVKLSSLVPSVGIGYINNRPCPVVAASAMDTYDPSWRNRTGLPTSIVIYGWNLIGLTPTPTAIYDISLEMFTEAPIPTPPDAIQLAPEHLAAVLDYAKHIAIFKLGGAEFTATIPLMERFFDAAAGYNMKLKAEAPNFWTIRDRASRDKQNYPRRPSPPTSEDTLGDIMPAAAAPGGEQ